MALAGQAEASVIIDIVQSGGDVVATDSGSVDLTDLSYVLSGSTGGFIDPNGAAIVVGSGDGDEYNGVSGPGSYGTGGFLYASSNTGGLFGVGYGQLAVPLGYVSGASLSGSSTYDGQTLTSLGLTPGTYVYTWGSGADADSATLVIESVPEPSTWAMMLLSFVGFGYAGYRRAKVARTA